MTAAQGQRIKAMISGRSFPFRWILRLAARRWLMPRRVRHGEVIWRPVTLRYALLVVSLYDDLDERLVLDFCLYETMVGRWGAARP